MLYHPDDFLRLYSMIEEQNGTLLQRKCKPSRFAIKQPVGETGKMKTENVYTSGCHQETLFVVPYEVEDYLSAAVITQDGKHKKVPKMSAEDQLQRGAGFVTVCAKDDRMGDWPRFAGSIQEGAK